MKVWKKLSAVTLALVMVLALCVPAFAGEVEDMDGEEGKIGEFDRTATGEGAVNAPVAKTNQVTIYKEIKMFNPAETTIYPPSMSYSYAIEAGSANKEIDDTVNSVKVKTIAGVFTTVGSVQKPSITETVAWTPNSPVNATSTGTADSKPISIDFTGVVFPKAGVYRYVITETATTATYTAAGVTEKSSHLRYLDVYVMDQFNEEGVYTSRAIYGYVLTATDSDVVANTVKTEGFVGNEADEYHTFNLKITKQVTNDNYIASTAHQFPFSVTFTNTALTGNVRPRTDVTAPATLQQPNAATTFSSTGFTTTPTIGHNGSVTYYGIPVGTAASITETNNVSGATYKVTSTGATTDFNESIYDNASTANPAAVAAHSGEDLVDIIVTNDLQIISPTGVTLRYAPYLAMMGAGVVALPLTLRKKEEEF